jgi:long-chain acyl-CoA synthetase
VRIAEVRGSAAAPQRRNVVSMQPFGFRYFVNRSPSAVAVVDSAGREWTREELLELADRTASALVGAGLARGDVVAIAAPNCAEFLAVHLAALAAELYVVPVNWHLAEPEIAYILANSGAKAVFAHARLGSRRLAAIGWTASLRVAVSFGEVAGFVPLERFSVGPARLPAPRSRGRVLAYTSATTGVPKAVHMPLEGAGRALAKTVAWHRSLGIEIESGNVHLVSSMLYHAAPLDGAVVALEMGHAVVLMDGWDPESLLQTIADRGITTAFMVPTMFVRLLKLPEQVRRRYSSASLKFVIHSAAPCPADVKRRMLEWWGPIIWESYGASEVQGCIVSPAEWLERPGTVGRPIAGSQIMILDERGRELPPGQIGSIYLTPHTGDRFEYLGDAKKTAACRRGEYVTVGDRGYVDDAGYLFLVGRDSELIISSGMNIYPAEIEQALLAHPAITDCAVVGAPNALCGEVPEAHVQLAPGVAAGAQLTDELLRFLAERLSPMKLPRRIEYDAVLPRDPNGKLLKRRLQSDLGARHGR